MFDRTHAITKPGRRWSQVANGANPSTCQGPGAHTWWWWFFLEFGDSSKRSSMPAPSIKELQHKEGQSQNFIEWIDKANMVWLLIFMLLG